MPDMPCSAGDQPWVERRNRLAMGGCGKARPIGLYQDVRPIAERANAVSRARNAINGRLRRGFEKSIRGCVELWWVAVRLPDPKRNRERCRQA